MMTIKIEGLQRLARKLDDDSRDRAVKRGMDDAGRFLQRWIKNERLTGPRPQRLGVMTGDLYNSIAVAPTEKSGATYQTRIGTNMIYARIHEFGGVIKPVRGKYLTIPIRAGSQLAIRMGMWQYKRGPRKGITKKPISYSENIIGYLKVKKVTIPPRPFMRPAFEDESNHNEILKRISDRINEALAKE